MEDYVLELNPLVRNALDTLDSMRDMMRQIELHEREINDNEEYTVIERVPRMRQIDISGQGIYTTNEHFLFFCFQFLMFRVKRTEKKV